MKKIILILFSSFILSGILFFLELGKFSDSKMQVVVCDVGQGDAILIRTSRGSDILIDGGPNDSVLSCLNKHMPFWDRKIEAVILTHPDSDHLAGLLSVFKRFEVENYIRSHQFKNDNLDKLEKAILSENKISATLAYRKDRLSVGDVSLIAVWPEKGAVGDINNDSLVFLLTFKNFKMLLTGDSEEFRGSIGDIDVLKVAHHGSKESVTGEVLKDLKPELAIISVGENNRYNLPDKETIQILMEREISILRTDQDGDIKLVTNGQGFEIVD